MARRPSGNSSENASPATPSSPDASTEALETTPVHPSKPSPDSEEPRIDGAWAEPERRHRRKTSLPSMKHAPTPATLAAPAPTPIPADPEAAPPLNGAAALLAQLQQTILLQALLGQSNMGSLSPAEMEALLQRRLAQMDPDRLATLARSLGLQDSPVAAPEPAQKVRKRVIGPAVSPTTSTETILPETLSPESFGGAEKKTPAPAASSAPPSDSSWGPLQTGASQVDDRAKARNLLVYLAGEIPLLGRALVRDGHWRIGFIVSTFTILLIVALASVGIMTWRSSQLADERAAEAAEFPPPGPLDVASAESIRATLRGYYLAKSWEDLVPWVREADLVRPMMQNYY
ncbi:MAG TPA: hypothetical protein VMN36_18570, partial [Verrucomicrobiales bacterium]|nr:hypothetical protein [Verrucomicrobiales bacterium]